MNKREFKQLEAAYVAEIEGALNNRSHIYRTRSKVAATLADEGLFQRYTEAIGGRFPVRVDGYVLTHAGRILYCSTCEGE